MMPHPVSHPHSAGTQSGSDAVALHGVRLRYGATEVLRDVTLRIPSGDFLCVVGPNGAGKTTLLRVITQYLTPEAGQVLLFGQAQAAMDARARARSVALVPQTEDMLFPFTVRAMVMLGRTPHQSGFGFESAADHDAAERAIARTGLTALSQRRVTELSGGEQHRVAIARALAQETPLLLLDEPNAHLDVRYQRDLFALLAALNREEGRTIVCVTHDLNLAAQYATRIALLADGRIAAIGDPATVLTPERIAEYFGIPMRVRTEDGGRISVVALRD